MYLHNCIMEKSNNLKNKIRKQKNDFKIIWELSKFQWLLRVFLLICTLKLKYIVVQFSQNPLLF